MMERQPARCFQDLIVWQKAHRLVLDIYRVTKDYPSHETYGLRSQIRRAAVSIAANIAEGFVKRGKADKARFFNIDQGSLEEVRYYMILAHDLEYMENDNVDSALSEVSKLLEAYRASVMRD